MKFLVVSDTHRRTEHLDALLNTYGKTHTIIHCGDSELADQDPRLTKMYAVAGNCEWPSEYKPEERLLSLGGETLFVTHGHRYGVKQNLTHLALQAEAKQSTLCFYGHSHQAFVHYLAAQDCLILNPGSLEEPRNYPPVASYALVETSANAFKVEWYNAQQEQLQVQTFPRKKALS